MKKPAAIIIVLLVFFSGLAMLLSPTLGHIANAQGEGPELTFPESDASAQAKIDFYENEINKCKDYVDELSLAINKAQVLRLNDMEKFPGSLFIGYGWTKEISQHQDQTRLICNRIRIYQERIAGIAPPPSPTPTPSPNPSPSTETKSGEPGGGTKTKQDKESYDKQVALIKEYRQELSQIRKAANKIIKEMDDFAKKANLNLSGFKSEAHSNGGLSTTTFTTPQGRIILQLPADMRTGDTISGTVVAEPTGQTAEERSRNLATLNAYQLKIANEPIAGPWGAFTWSWLKQAAKPAISEGSPSPPIQPELIVLIAPVASGKGLKTVATAPITESSTDTTNSGGSPPATKFELPTVGQNGRTVQIKGPFDGNVRTTDVKVGGSPVTVIAESPRTCIFNSPEQNFGLTEITLKENNVEVKGPYRNVGVRLNAPKTNLMKSEKTTVTIEVSGLEGIKEDVPLQLESKGVINMEGGNFQNLVIHPKDVQAGGRFTTTRTITGVVAGGFGVTATVVVDRYDMCVAGFGGILQWLSFTGEYRFRRRGDPPAGGTQTGGTQTGGTQTGGTQTGGTGTGEITGKGKMVMKGCIITLSHNAPDRRVFARLDACNKTGSAEVQVDPDKTKVEITDSNTADNTCGSK